jgi:LmbE family N-acetylglucosaminyl deacetylase
MDEWMNDKKHIIVEKNPPLLVPKRILVFAPHPDDEILSTGGTILKYKALGSEITIVIATKGSGGYRKEENKENIIRQRHSEINDLQNLLDWKIIALNYENLSIEREQISKVTKLIREIKPQIVLSPHFQDTHRIHRNLSYIVRESLYHAATGEAYGGDGKLWQPLGVYYYESPSYKFQYAGYKTYITTNIDDYWMRKKELFSRIYKSQEQMLTEILTWAEHTAKLRGMEINSEYGEAFIPETTYTPLRLLLV